MLFTKKNLLAIIISLSVVACNQAGEENQTSTNTALTPLNDPNTATQTSPTTLQDIWVLDSMNNKGLDSSVFTRGTPYFDINLDKKTVTGHTGCNSLTGRLNVEGEKISFDSLVVLKEVCKDKGFEKKLIAGFNSGKTTYKIVNDKLHLDLGSGTLLIFRKIRR